MELAELIERLIDLKVAGEPADSDWVSIQYNSDRRRAYYAEIENLKAAIDAAFAAPAQGEKEQQP